MEESWRLYIHLFAYGDFAYDVKIRAKIVLFLFKKTFKIPISFHWLADSDDTSIFQLSRNVNWPRLKMMLISSCELN